MQETLAEWVLLAWIQAAQLAVALVAVWVVVLVEEWEQVLVSGLEEVWAEVLGHVFLKKGSLLEMDLDLN
jgi:hypothetical protein